jgi:flagellar hook-basal body complex protein FliE
MTAGIEAVAGIGSAAGVGGADLASLAQLYRNQLLSPDQSAAAATAATAGSAPVAAGGGDFAGALGNSITGLEGLDRNASTLAVQAATGDLTDIQDYVVAATQAQLAAQLTTTVRNKAVDAFNEIMRMPL